MAYEKLQPNWERALALALRQHGAASRAQLLACGLTPPAVLHLLRHGRLHRIHAGVYAVGRGVLGPDGRWMAAALAAGSGAGLSHGSGAAVLGIGVEGPEIEVSVPAGRVARRPGLRIHRRAALELVRCRGIPVTSPAQTLVDLAARLPRPQVERAVNEADKLELISPEALRETLDAFPRLPGRAVLRELLDRRTFRLTDSELERRFLPLAHRAGLPTPLTQVAVAGFRVDFLWPELGLVVETDGLRYHRTPAAQARDRLRDQTLAAEGLTPLRFTHDQVAHAEAQVVATLRRVAGRLRARRPVA